MYKNVLLLLKNCKSRPAIRAPPPNPFAFGGLGAKDSHSDPYWEFLATPLVTGIPKCCCTSMKHYLLVKQYY